MMPKMPPGSQSEPPSRHPPSREPQSVPPARPLNVRELLDYGQLPSFMRLVAGGEGLDRAVGHPRIQKSGLVLVGHSQGIVPTRVQILGETEITYLEGLEPEVHQQRVEAFFALTLSCVVVTRGVEPLEELVVSARKTKTPLLISDRRSSRTINAIHLAMDDLLAPTETVHGVLVDIHGVGVLLLGPSGIGKSECALFLVERGQRLVADDQVELMLRPDGHVDGKAPKLLRHHLEVRGIGVLNIRDLFGATAVREIKTVELVVELCTWKDGEEYERLGLEDENYELLGTAVPMLRVPVRPGRNMGVILEVAARNHLLKISGEHPARKFLSDLTRGLNPPEGGE